MKLHIFRDKGIIRTTRTLWILLSWRCRGRVGRDFRSVRNSIGMAVTSIPTFRVFISCVSSEFRGYREQLRSCLTARGREIKVQEDFTDGGATLLEKLDDYIMACQAVIHLVGSNCGCRPQPAEVRALLKRHPKLPQELAELAGDLQSDACPFTYTQWEAFLAIYHRVACFIYRADAGSSREPGWAEVTSEVALQEAHVQRLCVLGHDRRMVPFEDARDVALKFLSSVFDQAMSVGGGPGQATEQNFVWPQPPAHFEYPLADREPEFDTFIRLVTNQTAEQIYLIFGPSDRGKTVLVGQFAELGRMLGLQCAHAEFKTGLPLVEVLRSLSSDLVGLRFPRFEREQARGASETLRTAFLQDLDEARVPALLLLDTYEQANEEAKQWIEQRFLPYFRRHEGLRLVLAGKVIPAADPGRPWASLAISHELPPIRSAAPWCDYSRRVVGLTHPDELIGFLVEAAQGSPRVLGTLLANLKRSHA